MKTRFAAPLQARRGDPRGQVLVLFALMLVVLLLVSALAVDYGGWLVAKRNYQNMSDAAALAGAQQLTRPLTAACASGPTKNFCARQAAWESVKAALNLAGLNPVTQSATSSAANNPYAANGYKIWVASPPSDAGSAYLGHVSGPGNVYVRIEHPGMDYLSRIASINRTVTAWSTAGRFPANFAVIAMCSPTSITANCLAGDANIKIDGTGSNLIVGTGDLGTNRWTKTGGNNSGIALGPNSNAFMQLYDTCWANSTNQCQLWGYNAPNIDYTTVRSAIPLGAPIIDPGYPAPTTNDTTAPNECRGAGTVQLASVQVVEGGNSQDSVADLPILLASVVKPIGPQTVVDQVATNNDLAGTVKANVGGAVLGNINVSATNGTVTYNLGATPNSGANKGKYSRSNLDSGTYTITATDPTGIYHAATTTVTIPSPGTNTTYTAPDILMQKNPTISGTIRSSGGGTISGAAISITGSGGPYPATSGAGGAYGPVVIAGWGPTNTWDVNASAANYTSNLANSGFLALETNTVVDVTLTPAPANLTVNVTDQVTGLPIPNVTVTLTGSNSGTATTGSTGSASFGSVNPGANTTITLTAADLSGYVGASPSNLPNPSTVTINAGSNTANFALWPKGCGTANGDKGDWSCSLPSGNNCPAPTNVNAANVSCTFTQANAIRPGTYNDITLPNGTCAWFDPKGGVTGLATGQSAGIYHIKGTIDIGNGSYLFGDGVTLVMNQGSTINVGNSGGFVLNFGSVASGSPLACNLSTIKYYNDGTTPCFRTVPTIDGRDYAHAAWTTKGQSPWTAGPFPTYDDSVVRPDLGELGITFYLYGSGLGNNSRFKISTANMGYLFNGVLYGPNDDIQLGGGKDGQTAAGQLVGWTIEYHGGTRILQNWYADPADGQPFLIEPVLGE
jgi:Putative Flp pilus-assembly TadE/G-like